MSSSGYTAQTFIAGEVPTTTIWNLLWSNDASFNSGNGFNDGIITSRHLAAGISVANVAQNPYKFNAYRGSVLTLPSDSICVFDTELFDTGNNYNNATGVFTAPVAGFYFFSTQIGWNINGNANTAFGQYLFKNGTTNIAVTDPVNMYNGSFTIESPTTVITQLAANDTIAVRGVSTGGGVGVGASQSTTFFCGFLLSAT
jgi:hypothetical protein